MVKAAEPKVSVTGLAARIMAAFGVLESDVM